MKQNPPSMFFVKIDGAAVSEHDGSLSSAENKLVTQRRGREFERRKPFVVEMGVLARPSDIQRSFLSRAVRMARQIQKPVHRDAVNRPLELLGRFELPDVSRRRKTSVDD